MNFTALIEELDDAVVRGSPERRAEILRRVTDVFVVGSPAYSANQIELFDDVFVRIVASIEVSARAALANRLAKAPRAPATISRMLASANEIDVAGPVLEQSQRLDNDILVATARSKSQQHLLAISRRSSLDEAVTDVLVERGDKPVVLSTVKNPAARYSTPTSHAAFGAGLACRPDQTRGRQSGDGKHDPGRGGASRDHDPGENRRRIARLCRRTRAYRTDACRRPA